MSVEIEKIAGSAVSQAGDWEVSSILPASNYDAFGRLRVSDPVSIFDASFEFDAHTLSWDSSVTGGASVAHSSAKASVELILGTASGDSAIFQTRRYFKYHPGKSQFIVMTGVMGAVKTNVRRRAGQFDANNGFFFEIDGTSAYCVVRSKTSGSVVDTRVAQADWNGDKLDGTGLSGVTLDFSKQNILFVDYQWLGSGRVRFGTFVSGEIVYAHTFTFGNTLTTPYSQTGTLPLRVESVNTGTAVSGTTIHLTCATVYSEGGFAPEGVLRSAGRGITAKAVAATGKIPILSIRKASASVNVPVQMVAAQVYVDTTDTQLFEFWINTTLTGATFAVTEGKCELDLAATAISGGTRIHSFYVSNSGAGLSTEFVEELFKATNTILGASIAGVSDILTITSENVAGGASNNYASLTFKELS